MSSWPVHCRRHFSRCGLNSCSVCSQVELVVRLTGLKVFSRSLTSVAERQRMFCNGGPATPLFCGLVMTFHSPACRPSARAAGARSEPAPRRTRRCPAGPWISSFSPPFPNFRAAVNYPLTIDWANFAGSVPPVMRRNRGRPWTQARFLSRGSAASRPLPSPFMPTIGRREIQRAR